MINGRPIVYNPEFQYGYAMTLQGEGGFMLGPQAFSSQTTTAHTVLWEVARLMTQTKGSLAVDQTGVFMQSAEQISNKLINFIKIK